MGMNTNYGRYAAKGSLADWQAGVGTLAKGQPQIVLAVSLGLTGPMLYLLGAEGGGIHMFGESSTGKSSAAAANASVWGEGSVHGYLGSWHSTANAQEAEAAAATDTCLVRDEIGVATTQAVAEGIYTFTNGTGKGRLGRDALLKEKSDFRVTLFSTGETRIATKIAEESGRIHRGGQSVRLLDIHADRGLGNGIFDSPGRFSHAGKLADAIKQEAVTAYGTAGPEFVRFLCADPQLITTKAQKSIDKFVTQNTPLGCDEQVIRAAKKLGLIGVAGELAIKFNIAPWKPGEALDAAALALKSWIGSRGGIGSHEEAQAIRQVKSCIETHGEARFEPRPAPNQGQFSNVPERPVHMRLGYREGNGSLRRWYVLPEAWKNEVCKDLDPTTVSRYLAKHGMLLPSNTGNVFSQKLNIGGQPMRVYVLTAAILA